MKKKTHFAIYFNIFYCCYRCCCCCFTGSKSEFTNRLYCSYIIKSNKRKKEKKKTKLATKHTFHNKCHLNYNLIPSIFSFLFSSRTQTVASDKSKRGIHTQQYFSPGDSLFVKYVVLRLNYHSLIIRGKKNKFTRFLNGAQESERFFVQ